MARADDLARRLRAEGFTPSPWSNGPGAVYGEHAHAYRKVLYCAAGSIVFRTPDGDVPLAAGDRLELPAGTPHSAVVGPDGVTCVEAAAPG
jgi:quercetin dioxygenase-like cupin family protein